MDSKWQFPINLSKVHSSALFISKLTALSTVTLDLPITILLHSAYCMKANAEVQLSRRTPGTSGEPGQGG